MSKITRKELLAKQRARYDLVGDEHQSKIIAELVELFGYHPKTTIPVFRRKPAAGALLTSADRIHTIRTSCCRGLSNGVRWRA